MNTKYENDTAKKPNKVTARIEIIAGALEEILSENTKNSLIQESIPRLIRNIRDYNINYHSEVLDGHALYFEIKRVALKLAKKINTSYEIALKSLIEGVFSKDNPETKNLQDIFKKYDLSEVIGSAVLDHSYKR